jgi:hypothetical protein
MRCWNVGVSAVSLLSAIVLAGCGGERRSGAATAGDTAMMSGSDTAAVSAADTATRAARDTMVKDTAKPRDSATASAAPAPSVARATPPKKPAPRPRPASPPKPAAAPDTARDTAATTTARSDTAASSRDASAPLRDPYHRAPLDTVAPAVYDGWKQFNLNCARCHGEDVQGTTIAPHLIVSLRPDGPINTKELFVQTVCAGRPAKGMPAWCALGMEMGTIEAIYSYVKGRSEGKIHPGRPARRAG